MNTDPRVTLCSTWTAALHALVATCATRETGDELSIVARALLAGDDRWDAVADRDLPARQRTLRGAIGRASCRERVLRLV